MKLLIYSQTSVVQQLKFGNGYDINVVWWNYYRNQFYSGEMGKNVISFYLPHHIRNFWIPLLHYHCFSPYERGFCYLIFNDNFLFRIHFYPWPFMLKGYCCCLCLYVCPSIHLTIFYLTSIFTPGLSCWRGIVVACVCTSVHPSVCLSVRLTVNFTLSVW